MMNPILVLASLLIGIGFGALYRNLNRRNKGNTTVNPNPGKNEVRTEEDRQKRRALVAALVVGQKVLLESGVYCNAGTVVKVTPHGVDVQTSLLHGLQHELLHFDKNGCSFVTELPPSYDSKAHPLSPWGWKGNGTYEGGPWYIVALASDEEIASWKEAAARKTH
jgi:preprotein translocase subunit YajC